MKATFKLFFATAAFLLAFSINSTEAQTRRASSNTTPLKQQINKLKLDRNAKSQVLNWDNATNFQLNKDGNFTPCFPKGKGTDSGSTRNNSRPYEGPLDLTIETVNCAKIPCPGSFGENVVCWECH